MRYTISCQAKSIILLNRKCNFGKGTNIYHHPLLSYLESQLWTSRAFQAYEIVIAIKILSPHPIHYLVRFIHEAKRGVVFTPLLQICDCVALDSTMIRIIATANALRLLITKARRRAARCESIKYAKSSKSPALSERENIHTEQSLSSLINMSEGLKGRQLKF